MNLFGIATILAEFHPTGGVVQSYRFEPAMLLPYMTQAMLFQLVCEGFYCFFILFFIVRLFKTFIKEKLAFFKVSFVPVCKLNGGVSFNRFFSSCS